LEKKRGKLAAAHESSTKATVTGDNI